MLMHPASHHYLNKALERHGSMNGIALKAKLEKGERIYGTLLSSMAPSWTTRMKSVGVDFVFIDTEHTPMDRVQLSWICNVYKAIDIAPLVRIPSPNPFDACMASDAGASGILAPYIETVEQVKGLVGATKYRPLKGSRLKDVLDGKIVLNEKENDFFRTFNSDKFLFINIESSEAMNNLDALLSVQGLDGIVIGPQDLSINLGVPEEYGSKQFDDAVRYIIRKAIEHKKGVGNHYSWGIAPELEWAKAGMNIILHSADLVAFSNSMRHELNEFRRVSGEPLVGDSEGSTRFGNGVV
jgi:2-keto-3-deoxy-L-rhamnonate aldolase RhmA